MNLEYILVLCSCPDEALAARIAACLIEEHLAGCVSRIPGLRSTYEWQGERREDAEVLLLVKTTAARYAELELRLRALHPYELPEIIALPIVMGSEPYLAWLGAGSRAHTERGSGNPAGARLTRDPL
jgi:periplasmic divalent cation tolerance protein